MKYIILAGALLTMPPVVAELPAEHPPIPGMKENKPASSVPLPNEGLVKNTIQSGGYTYIEVEKNNAREWLAAPQMELEKGSHIRYSKGIVMKNFHSRTLDKSFEKILLVGSVKVIDK